MKTNGKKLRNGEAEIVKANFSQAGLQIKSQSLFPFRAQQRGHCLAGAVGRQALFYGPA